jgi:hypothetical protein
MCSPVDASTAKPSPVAACPDRLVNLPAGTGAAPQSPRRAALPSIRSFQSTHGRHELPRRR